MTEKKTEQDRKKTTATTLSLELVEAACWCGFAAGDGWPAELAHDDIARLQAWAPGIDNKIWNQGASTWRGLLTLAATSDALLHTKTTKRVLVTPAQNVQPSRFDHTSDWPDQYTRGGVPYAYTRPARYTERTEYIITPAALAAWLARAGHEPSRHIAAWIRAHTAPAHVANETIKQRNARWLAVFDAEQQQCEKGAQARAMCSIAKAEGVKEDTVKKALQAAAKARAERYRAEGVHCIKPPKNSASNPFNMVEQRRRTSS